MHNAVASPGIGLSEQTNTDSSIKQLFEYNPMINEQGLSSCDGNDEPTSHHSYRPNNKQKLDNAFNGSDEALVQRSQSDVKIRATSTHTKQLMTRGPTSSGLNSFDGIAAATDFAAAGNAFIRFPTDSGRQQQHTSAAALVSPVTARSRLRLNPQSTPIRTTTQALSNTDTDNSSATSTYDDNSSAVEEDESAQAVGQTMKRTLPEIKNSFWDDDDDDDDSDSKITTAAASKRFYSPKELQIMNDAFQRYKLLQQTNPLDGQRVEMIQQLAHQLGRSYKAVERMMCRRNGTHDLHATDSSGGGVSAASYPSLSLQAGQKLKAAGRSAASHVQPPRDSSAIAGRHYSRSDRRILGEAFQRYTQQQQVKPRSGRWIGMVRRVAKQLQRTPRAIDQKMRKLNAAHNHRVTGAEK